jgi:hypothetical protein
MHLLPCIALQSMVVMGPSRSSHSRGFGFPGFPLQAFHCRLSIAEIFCGFREVAKGVLSYHVIYIPLFTTPRNPSALSLFHHPSRKSPPSRKREQRRLHRLPPLLTAPSARSRSRHGTLPALSHDAKLHGMSIRLGPLPGVPRVAAPDSTSLLGAIAKTPGASHPRAWLGAVLFS